MNYLKKLYVIIAIIILSVLAVPIEFSFAQEQEQRQEIGQEIARKFRNFIQTAQDLLERIKINQIIEGVGRFFIWVLEGIVFLIRKGLEMLNLSQKIPFATQYRIFPIYVVFQY